MTRPPLRERILRWGVFGALAVVAALLVTRVPARLLASPFGGDEDESAPRAGTPLASAFGVSGQVRLQLRMPGELFEFPVDVAGGASGAAYGWVRAEDSASVEPSRTLAGTTVAAPGRPGFYRLQVQLAGQHQIVDSIIVGVMVPFSEKIGSTLNGYRIGTYAFERMRGDAARPPRGFIEVFAETAELPVSSHFRMADFLTHDGQERWPRYVALDPRILDKVELVLSRLGVRDHQMSVGVNSGFRTPLHNQRVPRAASDSRHQYGDAADLAIDADGDGTVTYLDGLAVAHAVELVERDHPELVGGLGLYGNRGTSAYVHIDVRGKRSRWTG
jgi:uncharacterized protein YcbK (DUF882 family)